MLELVIYQIICIILFILVLRKAVKDINYITITLVLFEVLGLVILPLAYATYSLEKWKIVISVIFALVIPLLVVIVEYMSNLAFSEFIIIVVHKILLLFQKKKEAKQVIISHLKRHNNSYILHKMLGNLYEKEGGIRKALAEYIQAVEINPKDYNTIYQIVVLFLELDQKQDALYMLDKLIKFNEDFEKAYLTKIDILLEMSNYKEAQSTLAKCKNKTYQICYNNALVSAYLSEFGLVKESLKLALAENKKSYACLLNLAQIYLMEKEYKRAQKLLEEVVESKQFSYIAYYELAKIYLLNDQKQKAIDMLNKAVSLNPQILEKINQNILFKDIKSNIIVKVSLVETPKKQIDPKVSALINILEEAQEKAIMLDENEKIFKTKVFVNEVIQTKDGQRTLEDMEKSFEQANKFIKENIDNA